MSEAFIYTGAAIAIAGQVMFLVAAQRIGRGWFLWCLFVPIVGLLFIVLHFRIAWKPLVVQCAGLMALAVGMRLGGH